MRLGTRIFLSYTLIFLVCSYYPVNWMLDNLRIRYLEGVEDPLVDEANILASVVGADMETNRFHPGELYRVFQGVYARPVSARIYSFTKARVDMRVYITDRSGKVVFDSKDEGRVGKDYMHWRDVRLTLQGKYGARTTKRDPADPTSSVLHVAAPIFVGGELAGVLTVAKPTSTINTLIKGAKPEILKVVGVSLAAAVFLSFLVSLWMTRPIKLLTRYANDVREGKKVPLPPLRGGEIGEMGSAFEKMREALEGKKYVEDYVQTLTHEVKSPVSAIRAAAELLGEKMEPGRKARFLANIRSEADRIGEIADRMLELTMLENLKRLGKKERVPLDSLVKAVFESKQPLLLKKGLTVTCRVPADISVEGERFLLHQALSNLLQNAIDFSPENGGIEVSAESGGRTCRIFVRDRGPGVPDYAAGKIFEKFFSLRRPGTGKKSTGLGLNFVRAVAELHGGKVGLESLPGGGACATLTLPCL
jgi:two-component system sensor histidine kinase CreC